LIRGRQQYLTVAFEKCPGYVPRHIVCERDFSVIQRDVNGRTAEREIMNAVDLSRIQSD
jgi:hypothetical protein